MVKAKEKLPYRVDGSVDVDAWLSHIKDTHSLTDISLLQRVCVYTQNASQGLTTFYGRPYLEQGLDIASTLLSMRLDLDTVAAGIISSAIPPDKATQDKITAEFGEAISKLVAGVRKAESISALQKQKAGNRLQIDKIRKLLLAMATDIRMVMIKLAERLCFMRAIKSIPPDDRQYYAQEILDIYAPLANRLGIGQLKWELEDIAFHYQHPATYKKIAGFLAERRTEREQRIQSMIYQLKDKLNAAHIQYDIHGRAKHIYSIYLKMTNKRLEQEDIFDYSAIRVLVPSIEDCYTALSIVNSLWPPILNEFDDYIANPKPNGYRSIHTAVIGEGNKHFEIQIRSHEMHEISERGVAAHWMYKEGKASQLDDQTKIAYLRQLLDWHRDIAATQPPSSQHPSKPENEMVYVITPHGDIMDLPQGSTPIDFAYHIHSDIGHRCRGAKINGHIVPLSYQLQTGDKIEVHTIAEGAPSRDWLNPEFKFIKTTRARNKISHWFKQQALNRDMALGRESLEKELARHGLTKTTSLIELARHFSFKNEDDMFAALGRGSLRISQILHVVQRKPMDKMPLSPPLPAAPFKQMATSIVSGASDLLTRYAKCCKPIPGDAIVGYITQAGGISIHKKSCSNVANLSNPNRFIEISWDNSQTDYFVTDLKITTAHENNILHDITALFISEKVKLLALNSNTKKDHGRMVMFVTLEIANMGQLRRLQQRMQQLPGVLEVVRVKR